MDNVSLNRASDSPTSVVAGSSPLRSPVTPQSQFQMPILSSQQPSTPTYFSKICSSRSLENDENEHYNPEEVYKCVDVFYGYICFIYVFCFYLPVYFLLDLSGKPLQKSRIIALRNPLWRETQHHKILAYRSFHIYRLKKIRRKSNLSH